MPLATVAKNGSRVGSSVNRVVPVAIWFPDASSASSLPYIFMLIGSNRASAQAEFETARSHDRAAQTRFHPGGILLENQDVGTDVQRRMGKPVRRLRALLPGKAGRRGRSRSTS